MRVKKSDLKVIIPVLLVAVALFIVSQVMPRESKQSNAGVLPSEEVAASHTPAPEATETPVVSEAPEATEAAAVSASPTAEAAASPVPTLVPAKAYLKVQIGNLVFEPIALTTERDYTLPQPDGKKNVVRVTPESIVMHSSTCDNQDCVHQGMVSLSNRDKRVLQNMIICLPNQVVLELMDEKEAQADWEAAHGKAAGKQNP